MLDRLRPSRPFSVCRDGLAMELASLEYDLCNIMVCARELFIAQHGVICHGPGCIKLKIGQV